MKLWEIFRFEVGYQARRLWTWVYFLALVAILLQITLEGSTANARSRGYFLNAPSVIAEITLLGSFMGLLVTAALAGDAAARDVQTGMHPLLYTSPVRTGTFLTGRFLAAFTLNTLILLAGPMAVAAAQLMPGIPADLLGPSRPGAYVAALALFALPNAFVATALLFSLAALTRRAIAGYLGAVVIFFTTMSVWLYVAAKLGHWTLGMVVDPMGVTVLSMISRSTTGAQKNTLSLVAVDALLINRVVWISVALAALTFTRLRFRFQHPAMRAGWPFWRRRKRGALAAAVVGADDRNMSAPVRRTTVPRITRRFAFATHLRQVIAVAAYSFREIATGWGGLVLGGLTLILVVFGPKAMNHIGVPLIPTTQQMTAFMGNTGEIVWTIVPLLTVFYAGELVWRERELGLSEISDAAPVPEWARLVGRFTGLVLVFVGYQSLLMLASMLIQAQLGYFEFQPTLYLQILFGLQLPDHLLFALVAFTVHVIVDQKYVGHLIALAALAFMMYASGMGIEHKLLIYASDTGWTFSDLKRFGPAIPPWLTFKLYWGGWAILLAVAAKLFWARGREGGVAARLRTARQRLTRPTAGVAAVAAVVILTLGAFAFYNTNVLNAYETSADRTQRRVDYERRYRRYADVPQPRLTRTTLRVELYPDRGAVEMRGSYGVVNTTGAAIDSIHLAPDWEAETGPVTFDRPSALVLDDAPLGHRIYVLETPLAPGDSLHLDFTVRFVRRGFTNAGVNGSVTKNGTFLDGHDWLPGIGYRGDRELANAGQRRQLGLPPRVVRALDDPRAREDMQEAGRVTFETIVGTEPGQIAVAPGALQREWTENGRRYFHYVTDTPIRNDFAIFSAAYAVHEAVWHNPADVRQTVAIQILHHPTHTKNLERMVRSVQASLSYFTAHFGPYPHRQVRFVEQAGNGNGLHAYPVNISYEEEFSLFDADADPREVDFPFAVVAHEMGHQWWGNLVTPARAEGGALLTESLAWYTAMAVVEAEYGADHLTRLRGIFREAYQEPRPDAAVPLLRSYDRFHGYRKGPFVMYALREYVGADSVNVALRRLADRYGTATPPLPTSMDLYRELQAITPDSLHYLLADLFEANTFWELRTKRVTATEAGAGNWQVTLDVSARKFVVDTASVQADRPMNDLIEVGVYADAEDGELGRALYLRMHRVRSGDQRITVTVPARPARGGLDPRNLLIDVDPNDNVRSAVP